MSKKDKHFKYVEFISKGCSTTDANKQFLLANMEHASGNIVKVVLSNEVMLDDTQRLIVQALNNKGAKDYPKKDKKEIISKLLEDYYAEATSKLKVIQSIGWTQDYTIFATPSQIITQDKALKRNTFFESSKALMSEFASKGSLEDWNQCVANPSKLSTRLMFGIMASFAAPLMQFTGDRTCLFQLYGTSSKGKTTVLKIANSVWNSSKGIQSWNRTIRSIETLCMQHNNVLLAVDDTSRLCTGSDKTKQTVETLRDIAYCIENEQGRATMTYDNSQLTWKTIILSSGERAMFDLMVSNSEITEGARVRFHDIHAGVHGICDKKEDNTGNFIKSILNAAENFYGTAGVAFVKKLQKDSLNNADELRKEIASIRSSYFKKAGIDTENHMFVRVSDSFALVFAAGVLASRYGVINYTEDEIFNAINTCHLATLPLDSKEIFNQRKAEIMALVLDYYKNHKRFFVKMNAKDFKEIKSYQGLIVRNNATGINEICFKADIFDEKICKNYGKFLTLQYLEEFLLKDSSGKFTNNRKTPLGKRRRFYCVNLNALEF